MCPLFLWYVHIFLWITSLAWVWKAKGTGFQLHLRPAIITSLTQSTLHSDLNLELYFFQNYPFWNIKRSVFSLFKQMEALTGASMQYLGVIIFSKLLVLLLKLLRVLIMQQYRFFLTINLPFGKYINFFYQVKF